VDGAVVCSHSETSFRNEKRESAMVPRPDGPLLKSLDVSLQVLEALDDGVPERGISDLARDLGVSKAAVYRILSTFARRGYVAQNPATSPPASSTCCRSPVHSCSSCAMPRSILFTLPCSRAAMRSTLPKKTACIRCRSRLASGHAVPRIAWPRVKRC